MGNGRCAGRPRLKRRIGLRRQGDFFKPQGRPLRGLDVVELSREELEALRLKDAGDLDQNECAARMNTSQSTFQRILSSARKKVSNALISGKAIKIN